MTTDDRLVRIEKKLDAIAASIAKYGVRLDHLERGRGWVVGIVGTVLGGAVVLLIGYVIREG